MAQKIYRKTGGVVEVQDNFGGWREYMRFTHGDIPVQVLAAFADNCVECAFDTIRREASAIRYGIGGDNGHLTDYPSAREERLLREREEREDRIVRRHFARREELLQRQLRRAAQVRRSERVSRDITALGDMLDDMFS